MDKNRQAAALIERMKAEITEDIAAGIVPGDIASFSALHDYRDANCYGGLCEDEVADALIMQFGGRDEHEGMPQGVLDIINQAQYEIDVWLKAGRPRE